MIFFNTFDLCQCQKSPDETIIGALENKQDFGENDGNFRFTGNGLFFPGYMDGLFSDRVPQRT
jgi:hypothetical protein